MTTADQKQVKIHEFTADGLTQKGEYILCALIIGPDRDEPDRKTLHMRSVSAAIEELQNLPRPTRLMVMEHMDRLLAEFRKIVLG